MPSWKNRASVVNYLGNGFILQNFLQEIKNFTGLVDVQSVEQEAS
jgi:hypothetical protein